MGMYTTLIKKTLKYVDEEQLNEISDELVDLFDYGTIKFYGYFTDEYLQKMAKLGSDGIIEGEITVFYEEGDNILCRWDKNGFTYIVGDVVFNEDKKILVTPDKQ